MTITKVFSLWFIANVHTMLSIVLMYLTVNNCSNVLLFRCNYTIGCSKKHDFFKNHYGTPQETLHWPIGARWNQKLLDQSCFSVSEWAKNFTKELPPKYKEKVGISIFAFYAWFCSQMMVLNHINQFVWSRRFFWYP